MEWVIIGLLYALGIGFFRLIGGVGSAGEAFTRWGEASAKRRLGRTSSSSPS